MRIISLLPAATEILACFGSRNLQVLSGRPGGGHSSDPADHAFEPATGVGIDRALLHKFNPELIILGDAMILERGLLHALDPQPALINLQFNRLADLFENTLELGDIMKCKAAACRVVTNWKAQFDLLQQQVNAYLTGPKVAILLPPPPPPSPASSSFSPLIAPGLWVPDLIHCAGAVYPLNEAGAPHRQITAAQFADAEPDYLLRFTTPDDSAPELYPEIPPCRSAVLDDPTIITIPGPRLLEAFRFIVYWLHDLP